MCKCTFPVNAEDADIVIADVGVIVGVGVVVDTSVVIVVVIVGHVVTNSGVNLGVSGLVVCGDL